MNSLRFIVKYFRQPLLILILYGRLAAQTDEYVLDTWTSFHNFLLYYTQMQAMTACGHPLRGFLALYQRQRSYQKADHVPANVVKDTRIAK